MRYRESRGREADEYIHGGKQAGIRRRLPTIPSNISMLWAFELGLLALFYGPICPEELLLLEVSVVHISSLFRYGSYLKKKKIKTNAIIEILLILHQFEYSH